MPNHLSEELNGKRPGLESIVHIPVQVVCISFFKRIADYGIGYIEEDCGGGIDGFVVSNPDGSAFPL